MSWITKKKIKQDEPLAWIRKQTYYESATTKEKSIQESPEPKSALSKELEKLERYIQEKTSGKPNQGLEKQKPNEFPKKISSSYKPRIFALEDSPQEFYISPFSDNIVPEKKSENAFSHKTSFIEDEDVLEVKIPDYLPTESDFEPKKHSVTQVEQENTGKLISFYVPQEDPQEYYAYIEPFPKYTEKNQYDSVRLENKVGHDVKQEAEQEIFLAAEPTEETSNEENLSIETAGDISTFQKQEEEFTEQNTSEETSDLQENTQVSSSEDWVEEILDHPSSERASITPFVASSKNYGVPANLLSKSQESVSPADMEEAQEVIAKLEKTLRDYGIEGYVLGIQRGPIITRYEMKLAAGTKVSKLLGLTDEIAMALEALRVRIEAPIPGRSTVGIEIPNKERKTVYLGDIVDTPQYRHFEGVLPLPLGKDIAGNVVIADLNKMPHILIAGATGSGKSVAVNSFITSFIMHKTPEELRFLLIDPKLVELSHYNDIPHLLHPVITDAKKAIFALAWAVEEMERRYEDMAEMRARNIQTYNQKIAQLNKKEFRSQNPLPKMPYIVILIDELGDLMMVAGKEVEASIVRLSQKARAVGIHLILATQRPSVDVITALIKANCPARIALQVAQKTDSRTILDGNGAEQLLGQGDMLFKHPTHGGLIRIQTPYVTDDEVEAVVKQVMKLGKPSYITLEDPTSNASILEAEEEILFEEAWNIIKESGKASASFLQRRLRIGYNKAARLIEALEARGYIGPQIGSKPREILR
ncbi:MAG: DNA translocase FtsK [Candidatus Hydrogenedentota bacterium]|nr:MAG: DNA translocase FtsK [Candidatus Hydrogenedentota bacterium]